MKNIFSSDTPTTQTSAFWQLQIIELQKKLEALRKEKKDEINLQKYIEEFYPLLQWDTQVPLQTWAQKIVNHLARVLRVPYVKFYISQEKNEELFLEPIATFGNIEGVHEERKTQILREVMKTQKKLVLKSQNSEQFLLNTSLGKLNLLELQIFPLVFNEKTEGVLVLGFVYQDDFLKKLTDKLVSLIPPTLSTIKQRLVIQKLLEQAQTQNEMLMAQEEELRQNLEEMESIQEQLRKTQTMIEIQRNQLSAVIDSMEAMVVAINKNGQVTLFNPPAEQYFKRVLNLKLDFNIPLLFELETQRSSLLYLFKGALKKRSSRTLLEDKRVGKHFEVVVSPIITEQGNIQGACMVAQDVTELLKKEQELKRNQRRFRYLVDNLPGIVYIAKVNEDNTLSIEFLSERFKEYLGMETEKITSGKVHYMDLVVPEDREKVSQQLLQAVSEMKDMEMEHRLQTPFGNIIWVYHRAKPYRDERGVFLDGFMLDVTERVYLNQYLEQEVQKRTAELRQTLMELEGLREQLIHSEKMAILGQMFAGIAHEVKTPVGAIIGSVGNIEEMFPQLLQKMPQLIKALGDKIFLFTEFAAKLLNEQEFLSSREARKLRKQLVAYLQKQNIENADIIARRLISAGFARKNLGKYIELFKDGNGLLVSEVIFIVGQLHMNIDNIQIGGQKVQKILEAIKKYTHSSSPEEKVPTDVIETIETILVLYHNQLKYNIQLETRFEKVPKITANPDELGQVWTNLISNALQAMDNQGKLIINVKNEPDFVVVEIIDSGKGIPPEIIDKIFDPFFTTKARGEGTGLGLHLSKQIIERHNGKIEVTSEPGRTEFKISLPKN